MERPYLATLVPKTATSEDPELWSWLQGRYGPRAGLVYDLCISDPKLSEPLSREYPIRLGELFFAQRHEKAIYAEDLIERRTRLSWYPPVPEIEAKLGMKTSRT